MGRALTNISKGHGFEAFNSSPLGDRCHWMIRPKMAWRQAGHHPKKTSWRRFFFQGKFPDLFFQVNFYGFYHSKSPFKLLPFGIILILLYIVYLCFEPPNSRKLGGGNSNIFYFHPLLGEDSHFDEHTFQMGWNRQTVPNLLGCPRKLVLVNG